MYKIACNINRSGKAGHIGDLVLPEPIVPEVHQKPDAAISPFDVYLVVVENDQLRSVEYDQLRSCQAGSVYALLCMPSIDGESNHLDVFFISQLLGASNEFVATTGESVRTVWLRTIRRPGQSGPYGSMNRVDTVNVKSNSGIFNDEVYLLPAVDSLFSDPLSAVRRYSLQTSAGMDMTLYMVGDTEINPDGVGADESYLVYYGHFVSTKQLKIDAAVPVMCDLSYGKIPYNSGSGAIDFAGAPVLGIVSLAVLNDPARPDSSDANHVWSCLHKQSGSSAIDTQLLVYKFVDEQPAPSKSIVTSMSAVGDSDMILNWTESAYKDAGAV